MSIAPLPADVRIAGEEKPFHSMASNFWLEKDPLKIYEVGAKIFHKDTLHLNEFL